MTRANWKPVGTPRTTLTDARLQSHWAAQPVSAIATTLLPPADDFSHTNLGWDDAHQALVTHPIPGPRPFRVGLRIADLTLLWLDDGSDGPRYSLAGRTLTEAYAWLRETVQARRGSPCGPLAPAAYEMPEHPVGDGAPFQVDAGALAELARWYGNADWALHELLISEDQALEVRCWPHHFDIASIVYLSERDERAPQIGVGCSPGDDSYDEPYWYVTPYPLPESPAWPPLEGSGVWRTEGWSAAILTASSLESATAAAQAQQTLAFLRSAIAAGRRLIG